MEENEQIKFVCDSCQFEADTKAQLSSHKENSHINRCSLCDFETDDKILLIEHNKTGHTKVLFACKQCDFDCEKKELLAEHNREVHIEHEVRLEMFKCSQCDYTSKRKKDIVSHRKEAHVTVLYQCDKCDITVESKKILKEHMKNDHDDNIVRDFQCHLCTYKGVTAASLEQHKRMKHTGNKEKENYNNRDLDSGEDNFEEVKKRGFKKNDNHGNGNLGGFSKSEKRSYCTYWNRGICSFGDRCRNLHEEIQFCRYDRGCRNERCGFFHTGSQSSSSPSPSSSSSFLARGRRTQFRFRAEEFPQIGSRSRGFRKHHQQQNQRR